VFEGIPGREERERLILRSASWDNLHPGGII